VLGAWRYGREIIVVQNYNGVVSLVGKCLASSFVLSARPESTFIEPCVLSLCDVKAKKKLE
jgi:hypothetical protein